MTIQKVMTELENKTGINWCMDVSTDIIELLTAEKGRINIKGKINGSSFTKTLMLVKNSLINFLLIKQ